MLVAPRAGVRVLPRAARGVRHTESCRAGESDRNCHDADWDTRRDRDAPSRDHHIADHERARPRGPPPEARAVDGLPSTAVVLERAPIESLDLRVAESAPPQHFIDVTSGLPNGCAHFYGYQFVRAGSTITVTVWNTMPADIRAACTMQYAVTVHAIPLGASLVSGRQYTLRINDKDTTFIAR